MRRLVMAGVLCMVTAGSSWAGSPEPPNQVNWQPNRYHVKCTDGTPCLAQQFYGQIAKALRELSARYKSLGWRMPANFGRVYSIGGLPSVEVKHDNTLNYAYAVTRCPTPRAEYRSSVISFGRQVREVRSHAFMIYYFFAHELFHNLQVGFPAFNKANTGGEYCGAHGAGWIMESTATDVGMWLTRQKYGTMFPLKRIPGVPDELMTRLRLNAAGLNHYHHPLNENRQLSTGHIPHYHKQSMWRHIAEVHFGDKRDYLRTFFKRKAKKDDWLQWIHDNGKAEIGLAFPIIYTVFLADFAGWWAPGRPGAYFKENLWMKLGFGGCKQILLTQGKPWKQVDLKLARTSGQCVKVTVGGLADGQRVSIKAAALGARVADVDQINFGLAWSKSKFPFSCSEGLRKRDFSVRMGTLFRCFFVGNNGTFKLGGTTITLPARIWDTLTQSPQKNGRLINQYVVTRVDPEPTDFPKNDGGAKLAIKLVISADFSSKKVAGRTVAKKTVAHLNEEPVFNAQEKVPKHNAQGGMALPLLYDHMGGANIIPPIPLHPPTVGNKKGIWMLRVTDVTTKKTGVLTEDVKAGESLTMFPLSADQKSNRPLQIGDKGRFLVHVQGTVGRMPVHTQSPATLTVHEFSPYVLNATVSGTVCDVLHRDSRKRCINPRPLEVKIVKAMAGLYHPDSRYYVKDTPSTKQHRAHTRRLFRMRMSSGSGAGSGGGAGSSSKVYRITGPYSSKVHRVGKCDCTCNDQYFLNKIKLDLKSGRDKESPAMWKVFRKLAPCMRVCTPTYLQCHKTKRKRSR